MQSSLVPLLSSPLHPADLIIGSKEVRFLRVLANSTHKNGMPSQAAERRRRKSSMTSRDQSAEPRAWGRAHLPSWSLIKFQYRPLNTSAYRSMRARRALARARARVDSLFGILWRLLRPKWNNSFRPAVINARIDSENSFAPVIRKDAGIATSWWNDRRGE